MNRYAIAFVCNDDAYKEGVYAACHSFRKHNPFVEILIYTYDRQIFDDPVLRRYADQILLGDSYAAARWCWGHLYPEITYTNLTALRNQKQYDAVCVADSDMLFTKDLTYLFDLAVTEKKVVGNLFEFQNVKGLSKWFLVVPREFMTPEYDEKIRSILYESKSDEPALREVYSDNVLNVVGKELYVPASHKPFRGEGIIHYFHGPKSWQMSREEAPRYYRTLDEIHSKETGVPLEYERIVCINLDSRQDRWEQFKTEFPQDVFSSTLTRFSAVDGTKVPRPSWWKSWESNWGCYLSHRQLLENALESGTESLLVFEDDAVFIENFSKRVREFHAMLPTGAEWIFYGGEHFKPERYPIERVNSCVCRANRIVRTHAYGIRSRRAMKQILAWIQSPEGWYHFHVDTRYADLMQRHSIECFAPNRWLVHQRAGHSDIMSKYMDYRFADAIDYWM